MFCNDLTRNMLLILNALLTDFFLISFSAGAPEDELWWHTAQYRRASHWKTENRSVAVRYS